MRAVSYLNDPACIFIATNEDSRLPTKGKVVIPGYYHSYTIFNVIL